MGWFHLPLQPMGPSGMGGPTRWTPPKLSRWPKLHFLYIILHLRTILELHVTSGTPNNFWVTAYSYLYNPSITEP